jgi:hypothetical protein
MTRLHITSATAAAIIAGSTVLLSQPAAFADTGVTYFVAPVQIGAGNCETAADACDLSTGMSDLVDGDTVQFADGDYTDVDVTVFAGVTLAAAPGAHPVLHGTGTDNVVTVTATQPVTMDGLTVTDSGSGFAGVSVTHSDPTLGHLTLDNSALVGNATGLATSGTTLLVTIDHSTISGNATGIASNATGTLSVLSSNVSNNSGTGLAVQSSNPAATKTNVVDSTFAGNHFGMFGEGTLTVVASTVTGSASIGVDMSSGAVNLGADIIAGNFQDCDGDISTDLGFNIDGDGDCELSATAGSVRASPTIAGSLLPLADNGGPTQTVGLTQSSPAINLVTGRLSDGTLVCGASDQRGARRPPGTCDAGAYEASPALLTPDVDLAVTPGGGAGLGAPIMLTADVAGAAGAPTGTVRFTADGTPIGGCSAVPIVAGSAQCVTSTLVAGSYNLRARYGGDLSYRVTRDDIVGYQVRRGTTKTHVVVHSQSVAVTVTPVAPATGTPTGDVTITVDGSAVATRSLDNTGAAHLTRGMTGAHGVGATYAGDDQFKPSSGATETTNPTLTAALTSSVAKTSFGWYRVPVTVTFTCTPGTGALLHPCPVPAIKSANGANQTVVRTISAIDGGTATLTVGPINIDQIVPTVEVDGVVDGGTYPAPQQLICSGHDALSGIASCIVSQTLNTSTNVEHYTATAKDQAGNIAVLHGSYHVQP